MSDFIQQALESNSSTGLAWLNSFQQAEVKQWASIQFPHRKTEHWKYTSLRALEQGDYFPGQPQRVSIDSVFKDQLEIPELDSLDLVFVNGCFDASSSSSLESLPEGLTLSAFSRAGETEASAISSLLGSVAKGKDHLFVTLNNSAMEEGAYIHVEKNKKIDKTIRIINVSLSDEQNFSCFPRLLIDVEVGAELSVVEHFVSDDAQQSAFVNAVTEINLNENARLYHYRLHEEHESSVHIGGVHAALAAHSNYDSFHLGMGGKLKRIDVVVNHNGSGAHCEMNGVYLPKGHQHIDYHTCIEHAVPHCTTNEVFRGIIGDSAKAVFNGRIHIHPNAQKTFAQLSNKNLLTSHKAEIDTKPELEIYADDVQCAHGATVAQLDEMSMHYLKTRGVSEEEARVMLSFGFINELVDKLKSNAISQYLRPRLAALFASKAELTRHLL